MTRVLLMAALCLLCSCGGATAPEGGNTPPLSVVPSSSSAATAIPLAMTIAASRLVTPLPATPSIVLNVPPMMALSYGDTTRSEWPVSSTWSDGHRVTVGDGFPHPGRTKPLVAPVGVAIILTASGAPPPAAVEIRPYVVVNEQPHFGEPALSPIPAQIDGQRAIIRANLASGDYLFHVFAHWGGNQASYGFRVILTP